MKISAPAEQYQELFEFFSAHCCNGSEESKGYIDVSFVENLFRCVPGENATAYWDIMPNNLKQTYINFHGHNPLPL